MADPPAQGGASQSQVVSDVYESIGQKAENVASSNDAFAAPGENGINGEDADTDGRVVDEIESLCMNCHEQGITRLLLTRIPHFREVILMSFHCQHCSFKDSQIQSAGEIQPHGARHELRLTSAPDFARQVVKSDTCTVKFIEIDIEIPPGRGQLTNIEGLLSTTIDDLQLGQEQRKEAAPEVWTKLADIIQKGRSMLAGDAFPFRVSLEDPTGNSWIEPDMRDGVGKWSKVEYARTAEQNEALGLSGDTNAIAYQADSTATNGAVTNGATPSNPNTSDDIVPDEVYSFPATCPGCAHACVTHMKMVDIPYFKEVVLMSTVCDACGYRTNECKTGGAVPELGKKITLRVERPADLARDILKGESCFLEVPELTLAVNPGTLGGRFTTVEGLLVQVRDDLKKSVFEIDGTSSTTTSNGTTTTNTTTTTNAETPAILGGDGMPSTTRDNWTTFFRRIDEVISGETPCTVVLTDPLAGSYVQSLCAPDPDPQIVEEAYTRTDEEEEELGLRDMRTEGYEEGGQMEEGVEKVKEADTQAGEASEAAAA